MINKVQLSSELHLSRIVHGHWRLLDWNTDAQSLLNLTQQAIELGITSFDHADIYGDYGVESAFGKALSLKKALRKDIQIISKCGIKLLSEKYPDRKVKHYDYSAGHIIASVENSLKNLQTDYIDLLLLHRPAPFLDPAEVAEAFSKLHKSGKILHFGVSNFKPEQFEMLESYTDQPLVTNQVEISPVCLEHFENGNMDFFLKKRIKPMAWSPLGGGALINPHTENEKHLHQTLAEIARELNIDEIDKVAYSWLMKHPAHIIPVVGTRQISRLKRATEASKIKMSIEQWYKIYIAARGEELP